MFLKEHLGEKVDVEEDIAKKSKNIGDCCFGIFTSSGLSMYKERSTDNFHDSSVFENLEYTC